MLVSNKLTVRFGGVTAVDGVDFALQRGTVHCLIGPNGAGKSTFFKVVTGQLRPTGGRILLDGQDITGRTSTEIVRQGVGIKMQTPQLFDELTVRENIWLGAYRRSGTRKAAERTAELLDELALSNAAKHITGTLAHGIRQHVELAAVLAGDPALVLLDEPAAGLSDADVAHVSNLILRLRGPRTFLVVEHDMRFIRQIADRVTVFHQGRIFLEGDCDAVLADRSVKDIYLGTGGVAGA